MMLDNNGKDLVTILQRALWWYLDLYDEAAAAYSNLLDERLNDDLARYSYASVSCSCGMD